MRRIGGDFLVGLLLSACHGGRDSGATVGPIVVEPADVHLVASSEAWAHIADIQPAGDGRVWVLNSIEPFFSVVDTAGHVERTFGRAGGGPDEFGGPLELVRGPSGEVWTYDLFRNALRRISGARPRDLSLPDNSLPPSRLVSFLDAGMRPAPPWIRSQGNGFLVGRRRPSAPPVGGVGLWHTDIVRLRPDSGKASVEMFMPVADFLGDPTQRYPGATLLLPYPVWAVCGDGTVGLYDPLTNTLRRFTPQGREEPAVVLPDERKEPVTFESFFTMVYRQFKEQMPSGRMPDSARTRSILADQFRRSKTKFADVFPEYADLRCADDGTFWLQPFDVASGHFGHGPTWMRFDRSGSRTTVVFPRAFVVYRIESARVWGAMVDSLGVPSVAWVRIGG